MGLDSSKLDAAAPQLIANRTKAADKTSVTRAIVVVLRQPSYVGGEKIDGDSCY